MIISQNMWTFSKSMLDYLTSDKESFNLSVLQTVAPFLSVKSNLTIIVTCQFCGKSENAPEAACGVEFARNWKFWSISAWKRIFLVLFTFIVDTISLGENSWCEFLEILNYNISNISIKQDFETLFSRVFALIKFFITIHA